MWQTTQHVTGSAQLISACHKDHYSQVLPLPSIDTITVMSSMPCGISEGSVTLMSVARPQ